MSYTIKSIKSIREALHESGKKIVLATGFFDLLHAEHRQFLQKAKDRGDVLIVAVESDNRARDVKGTGRPIEPQLTRINHLLDGGFADYCVELDDDFNHQAAYDSLMAAVHPDVYAVSSHTDYLENKRTLAEKYGGKLEIVHEWNSAISTTKLIRENQV